MTTLKIENNKLEIDIEGFDKVWALKSHLTIPLDHVAGAAYDPEVARGWWHGFRLPGSHIPGVLTAGSYYQHKEWAFWDVHDPEHTIVITLKDERYQKLVLETKDPQRAVKEINSALGK